MTRVTVNAPTTIKVRTGSQQTTTKVQSINYGTTKLADASDLRIPPFSRTGDFVAYNANTNGFEVTPTPKINGDLVPSENELYDLGAPDMRFKSLFLSGNTITLGTMAIKADATSGSIAFVPPTSIDVPHPTAIVITQQGGITTANTTDGVLNPVVLQQVISNSVSYVAFTGSDSGFF